MARKAKLLPPADGKKVKPRADVEALHDGRLVAGMSPPNHMLPLDPDPDSRSTRRRWPLVSAMRPVSDKAAEAGDKRQQVGVFIDPGYPVDHWTEWNDQPPTWMDPHLLVRMAFKDPAIEKLLDTAFTDNTLSKTKSLEQALVRVFVETYLPTIKRRFEQQATSCVAEWLQRHYAECRLDQTNAVVKHKPRNGQIEGNQRKSKQSVSNPKPGEPNGTDRSKT